MIESRMACKSKKKLKHLVTVCVEDRLFDKKLKTSVFECVVEIVKNAGKSRFSKCFSSKTKKKMRKNRKLLSYLKDKKISMKKRKKRFLKSDKNEQDLFESYVIADFMKNCLNHD